MKILKPIKLSLLKKTYRFLGKDHLVISPLCFFRVSTGEVLPEMAQWPILQKRLGPTDILDMAMPKPQAEILLSGKAFAEGGEAVEEMEISIDFSSVSKRFLVRGNQLAKKRRFGRVRKSKIEPFVEMPLHAGNCYGGEGFGDNPAGKGFYKNSALPIAKSEAFELPNVWPMNKFGKKVKNRFDSYGSLAIHLPQRNQYAGTYDDNWQKNHFPGYAPDMNWKMFNAAMPDQQLKGFIKGNETVEIKGMHPDCSTLKGTLPDVNARVFVRDLKGDFTEHAAKIDTCWFFPEDDLGVLIYRTQTEVSDCDACNISELLLAYENNSDKQRSRSYYEEVLSLRTNEETALANSMNESQLSPLKSEEVIEKENDEVLAEKQRLKQQQSLVMDEMRADHNMPDDWEIPELAESEDDFPVYSPEAIKRGDIDLSALVDSMNTKTEKLKIMLEEKMAELDSTLSESNLDQSQSASSSNEVLSKEEEAEQSAETKKRVFKNKPGSENMQWALDQANAQQELEQPSGDVDLKSVAAPDAPATGDNPEMPSDNLARRFLLSPAFPEKPLAEGVKKQAKKWVQELMASGESLKGRDLAGLDLSGMDFSGLDLSETLFDQANLSACNFEGANLSEAVFCGAHLHHCNFRDANLSGVNLCEAQASLANFVGANFNQAWMVEARFYGCDFTECTLNEVMALKMTADRCCFKRSKLSKTNLLQAKLRGSDWREADISESILMQSDIRSADFSASEWYRSALIAVDADMTNFSRAKMERVQTGGDAKFNFANFNECNAEQCGFRGIELKNAVLEDATFIQCDFSLTDFSNARLNNSRFKENSFYESNLSYSECKSTNFYQSTGRKLQANYSNLENADFYNVELQQAKWFHSNSQCKNLNPTGLEMV